MSVTPKALGAVIAEIRGIRQLTQSDLAVRAGLTLSLVSLVEEGGRSLSQDALGNVATALRIPAEWLTFLASDDESIRKNFPAFYELHKSTKAAVRAFLLAPPARAVAPLRSLPAKAVPAV